VSNLLTPVAWRCPEKKAASPYHDLPAYHEELVRQAEAAVIGERPVVISQEIASHQRAYGASLAGHLASNAAALRLEFLAQHTGEDRPDTFDYDFYLHKPITLQLRGSAGQGLGAFLPKHVSIQLEGEANDSVGKSLSGGEIVVVPPKECQFDPADQVILGNCALYGATSGCLLAFGRAGDRFAVRNSGADAVVEGAGLHACEYMTGGTVVILGSVANNVGAGMTGGNLFMLRSYLERTNREYLVAHPQPQLERLRLLLERYLKRTGSGTAKSFLNNWDVTQHAWVQLVPVGRLIEAELPTEQVA
jgi:glutamate synthase (ferredoxin)